MVAKSDEGETLPVLKPTLFIGNCPGVLAKLARTCNKEHRHQQLIHSRAAAAAIYPTPLQDAICQGSKDEIKEMENKDASKHSFKRKDQIINMASKKCVSKYPAVKAYIQIIIYSLTNSYFRDKQCSKLKRR